MPISGLGGAITPDPMHL